MALTASKLSAKPIARDQTYICKPQGVSRSAPQSQLSLHPSFQVVDLKQQSTGCYSKARLSPHGAGLWCFCRGLISYSEARGSSLLCQAARTQQTRSNDCTTQSDRCSDASRGYCKDESAELSVASRKVIDSPKGLAEACKYVYSDAKYVKQRARNDIVLLSRGILSLDARARQDLAFLGSEFLKLDARARQDTGKIDHSVKQKAERLHRITTLLEEKAKSRLKTAADRHWSNGALEADLRRADFVAKQRAMEDTLMALEFLKNIHDRMMSNVYNFPLRRESGPSSANIMLEKNGKSVDFFSTEVSNDRLAAIQEAYWSMASALSEADGIDYTDPEELELLITTLLHLDAMDGKSSVTLLAECSNSPDVNTRRALANALASAPSMWTLGNAGMGALQRLAEDSNPAVAKAASRAIYELKKQWEIEEGDSWRFTMTQMPLEGDEDGDDDEDEHSHD